MALLAMAILASLSWQGLDGILRARDGTRDALDRTVRLATVVTQWEQDLQALHDTAVVPALAFDGQTAAPDAARRRRRGAGGLVGARRRLAALGRAGLHARHELQQGWLRSLQLLGNEPGHLQLADAASEWQIYFHRGGAWTNAQSSGDIQQPQAPAAAASAGDDGGGDGSTAAPRRTARGAARRGAPGHHARRPHADARHRPRADRLMNRGVDADTDSAARRCCWR